jgi:4-hydroxy-tetrahydrodipicolinate synthase
VRSTVTKFPLVAALKEVMARATGRPSWRLQRPPLEPLSAGDAARLMDRLGTVGFAMKQAV